ncbi:MAG TPA: GEVED domain-containing protein [Bacteroidia bacterium]|nr:GEVED domain-containing protein [Bacteroidia bacterium]
MNNYLPIRFILVLLAVSINSFGQVASPNYTFSTSVGTYTPITGGTVLRASNELLPTAWDAETDNAIPIGFTFTYNGTAYTTFSMCADGFIAMGNTVSQVIVPISSGVGTNNVISGFGRNLVGSHTFNGNITSGNFTITGISQTGGITVGARIYGTGIPAGTTVSSKTANSVTISNAPTISTASAVCTQYTGEIRYQTIGSSPSRTLVVQWKNARATSINNQRYNFQIRLNESDNSIEVMYGDCNFASVAATPGPQVGLRGNTNTDYNNRLVNAGSGHDWNTSIAGTANNSNLAVVAATVAPVSGRTFKWTPPSPASIDIALNSFVSPSVSCGSASETVTVQLKNEGSAVHNFATNPTTITVNITGAITTSVSATVNTGTLAVNGTLNVNCTPVVNMSTNGTYNFACSHATTGDGNVINDALATVSRVISRNSSFPYVETFAASPSPAYVTQTIAPNTTDNWAILFSPTFEPGFVAPPSLTTANNGYAIFASYDYLPGKEARLILPCMDFTSLTSPVITISLAQDDNASFANDRIRFEVSTDGGNTWSFVSGAPTCSRYNAAASTMFWQDYTACLSAYAGNANVRLALRATSENGFDMAVDQITVENACPTVNTLTATSIGFSTATINWNTIGCGSSAFDVEYGPSPSGPYTTLNLGLVNTSNLTGLLSATPYHFRVRTNCGGPLSPWSAFHAFTTLAAPPVNDGCPGSTLTPALACSFTSGTTVNATASGVAAASCGGDPDDDVWYEFTAPSTNVTITAQATSGIDIVLAIYQNNSCVSPAQVNCIDNTLAGGTETLNLTSLTIGNVYRVRVYDKNTASYGTFNICVTYIPPPPSNDNCAGATTLTPGVSCVNTNGTVEYATLSSPASSCGGNANDDVWYKFVATSTAVDITAVGALGMDMVIEFLEGSCGSLNNLACANLSGSGGTEVISQSGLTIGATYFIRVYDYGSGYPSNSNFDICVVNQVVLFPPPVNDLCGNAISLTSNASCVPTSGTTLGATNTGLAGSLCGGFVANPDDDVWYSFVATSTAHDIIVAPTAPLNAVLELRTGLCNGSLIQCVDGAGIGGTETLSLQGLTIATTYRIRVYGRGVGYATQGSFDICVVDGVVTPGPVNDNCAGAITVVPSGTPTCSSPTAGTVLNATQSAPSTNCFGTNNDDVWYKFVATQSVHNVIVTGSAQFDAVIEAFSGACGASGIACMDNTGDGGTETLSLTGLTPTSTYYIRVFDVEVGAPSTLTFTICVTTPIIPSPPVNDNCAGAINLIAGNSCSPYLQNAAGATLSPQSTPICGGNLNDDVWFKFTAAQTSSIIQATGQGSYDMAITAYSGSCVTTTFLDCINNNGPGQTETLVLNGLTVGQTYFLRVYDFAAGVPSNANISICVVNVIPPPVPSNDLCDDAIPLNCGDIAYGQNSNGGTSGGDPVAVCGGMSVSGINGIWYRVFGTGDYFRVSTCNGTTFNTKVAVYSGSCGSISCVASNDDFAGCGSGQQSEVSWQSVSGTDYFILVGGLGGVQGIFQLKFECFPCITPTVAGTITVNPVPSTSTVNDAYTLTLGGNTGDVVLWEFSLNGFGSVSSTELPDGNNDLVVIDRINGNLSVRAQVQNGPGCLVQTTPIVTITPRCASTINTSPGVSTHYITNVQFNQINNNSTFDASGDNYQDFQAQTTTVQKGFSYQLKIKTFGAAALGRVAWIDLNGDNSFSGPGENVLIPQSPVAGTSTHIITIPCTGINGNVRLRVMVTDGTPSSNPCDAASYNSGEIEEYTLNIAGTGYGTWIGGSNDWCLPSNWACNTVPNGSIDVTIPAGTPQIVLNCNATCRNINFQTAPPYFVSNGLNTNGFKLNVKGNWSVSGVASSSTTIIDPTITPGSIEFNGTLGDQTLSGKTTFNNLITNNTSGNIILSNTTYVSGVLTTTAGTLSSGGYLVLRSVIGKTALVNPMAGIITGDVVVERKIGAASGYHYLSSPVSGAFVNNTTSGWRDDFTILSALDNQSFIPGASYSQLASVWEYNEADINPDPNYGWISATGVTDPITPLKGFACVVPGNTVVDVKGPLNNASIPGGYALTNVSDGLNLIGNPYPSPISWNALRSQNSSILSTSGYKSFISSGGYAGGYGTWDGSTGTNGVTDAIASSQGIFANALTSGTINTSNTIRNTSYADLGTTFFNNSSVGDLLRMEIHGNGFANEMAMYFDPTASDSYESNRDATILFSPVAGFPNIFTVVDSMDLTINVMGEFNADKTTQIGLKIQTAGNYSLVLTDISTFAPSVVVYLEDTQLDTMINLRNQTTYTTYLPIGFNRDRFVLHFRPAVTFEAIDETCQGNDGSLTLNYPSVATYNFIIKDASGNVINTQNGVNGQQTVNNLSAGNYIVEMTFDTVPYLYSAVDYFTIAGGNAIVANMSVSQNSVDLLNNTSISFIANAAGATSFNWNFGDGNVIMNGPSNVSHTFNQIGSYNVTFTATNGICSDSVSAQIEVSNTSGLTAINSENIKIIAIGNKLSIQFEKFEGTGNLEMFNLIGERIYFQEQISLKGTKNVNFDNIATGQYLIKVTSKNQVFTQKVYLTN